MKEFPSLLNVNNKKNFPKLFYNRYLCYLRRDIYEHMIRWTDLKSENNYFELDRFQRDNKIPNDLFKKMRNVIIKELQTLGWKCKLSYADTGLFIFSSESPPPSCWDGEF